MEESISTELRTTLNKLSRGEYLKPTIAEFNNKLKELMDNGLSDREALIAVLDHLTEIMRNSQEHVEKIIQGKITTGEIRDASQSRVAVAGNNFQRLIIYALILNILRDNLPPVMVAFRPKQSKKYRKILEKYTKITIGDEIQKPDVDIMVTEPNNENTPVVIYSCKTSLRERAGQTYKWKLLYDMATAKCRYNKEYHDCFVKQYNMEFRGKKKVLVGFITADFYDEVTSPQHRGILSFFDFSYVSKPNVSFEKVKTLSKIIDDLNDIFR